MSNRLKHIKQHNRMIRYFRSWRRKYRKNRKIGVQKVAHIAMRTLQTAGPNVLQAPADLRLLANSEECNKFFYKIRHNLRPQKDGTGREFGVVNFTNVKQIDFAAACVLSAIGEDLKTRDVPISLIGQLPKDKTCSEMLRESGFLRGKTNQYGIPFQSPSSTKTITIEKGQDRIKAENLTAFIDIASKVYEHVVGQPGELAYLNTLIKEVCGNSVEWSDANHKAWQLNVKFMPDEVELIAVDLGLGILNTIHRDFIQIINRLGLGSELKILQEAFSSGKFSHSKDPNRNNGLFQVKNEYNNGRIQSLMVLTNNVKLDFDNPNNNREYKNNAQFKGTLFRWKINKNCIKL